MLDKYFSALTHRDFRIFWFGQIISLIGTWMQTISLPWLALTLTDSALLLGVIGALQFTPMIFISLFAGVISDMFNKRKIIICTQITLAIMASVISFLVFSKMIQYWHLVIIALIIGFANAIDMPIRQSFIVDMVGKDCLMNAIALNSAVFNTARIIGPALAGLIMLFFGMQYCFLINSLSFVPVIAGLFMIRPAFTSKRKTQNNILSDMKDGIRYIISEPVLLKTLLIVLIVGTFATNYNVLVPALAKQTFKLNESHFGFLMTCIGIGSLFGALFIAVKSKKGPARIIIILAPVFSSLIFIVTGFCSIIIITAVLLMILGFFNVIFFTTANSNIQLNSKDEFRGRVISVYALFFGGTTPFGNMFTGFVTHLYGAKAGFSLSGFMILIFILPLYLIFKKAKSG